MVVERGGVRRPRTDRRVRPRDPAVPGARLAHRLLPRRDGAPPRRQRDADSHARDALPADDAPAPERRARGVGAAPRRPRDPARTRCRDGAPAVDPCGHASRGRASALARELHGLAPPVDLRHGAREPEHAAAPRARDLLRHRASRCGGASSRTSRTGSARARAPATCSRRSCSRARSGSSWRSSRTRSTTSTSTRTTASGA